MHLPQLLPEYCSAANVRNTRLRKSVFCAKCLIAISAHLPIQECYRRAWIVRAQVEASAAMRSSLATAFRVSVFVPAFRWPAISWRRRWISLMLSFMCASFRDGPNFLSQWIRLET